MPSLPPTKNAKDLARDFAGALILLEDVYPILVDPIGWQTKEALQGKIKDFLTQPHIKRIRGVV